MIKRHALPATLTSTGRVTTAWVPGPAEALTGVPRWREIYARLRQVYAPLQAARLLCGAWRHGVTLSGPPIHTGSPRG